MDSCTGGPEGSSLGKGHLDKAKVSVPRVGKWVFLGDVPLPDYQQLSAALTCEVSLPEGLRISHKISFLFTYCIVHDREEIREEEICFLF